MELLLIRHGLPVRREVSEGIADPELSAEGHQQARLLADYLSAERIDALYASPLRRAIQTAQPLSELSGVALGIEDGVAESDRDSSEYIPVEELKAADDPRWHAMVNDGYALGAEGLREFHHRVVTSLEAVIDRHPGGKVAVACHAGVINVYLAHLLGVPLGAWVCHPGYTGIHRVIASRRGHRNVRTMNETAHLRGSGLTIAPGWVG